ncbi:hypothetical protein [Herbiconiux sp.]|uniref:hypothetical protein n=1 Tax=Herbiconiux sp. TaxID=1871186 RepID=UPI0025C69F0A|nr:hypothetical protein [Herbiconiux sp.]
MARTKRTGGSFRLGGAIFDWRPLSEPGLSGWVAVAPEGVADEPLPAGFLDFVAQLQDESVRTVSPWSVFEAEFEWPAESWRCGCLEEDGFADVALQLNGDALVATPGPVSDRFLLRARLVDVLGLRDTPDSEPPAEAVTVSFGRWSRAVGVDDSYFSPGYPRFGEPTRVLRSVITTHQSGDAHEAYGRAFDAYFYGGLPTRLAETNKRAHLEAIEAREGFDYVEGRDRGVTRRILSINSMRLRTSRCCTVLETRGSKIFASRLEGIAERTRFGETSLPLGFRERS